MLGIRRVANHLNYIRSNWKIVVSGFVLTLMSVTAVGTFIQSGSNADALTYYYGNYANYSNNYATYANNYNNYLNAYNNYLTAYGQYANNYNSYLANYNNYLNAYNNYYTGTTQTQTQPQTSTTNYQNSYDQYSTLYNNYLNSYNNYLKSYNNSYNNTSNASTANQTTTSTNNNYGTYLNNYNNYLKSYNGYLDSYKNYNAANTTSTTVNKQLPATTSTTTGTTTGGAAKCEYSYECSPNYAKEKQAQYAREDAFFGRNVQHADKSKYTTTTTTTTSVNTAPATNSNATTVSTTPVIRTVQQPAQTAKVAVATTETPKSLPLTGPSDDVKNAVTGGIIGFGSLTAAGSYYLRSRRDYAKAFEYR